MKRYTINAVFDTHVHARWDPNMIRMVLKHLVNQGIRHVIIEPNPRVSETQDGIYTWEHAQEYQERLNQALETNGDKDKLKFIVAIKMTPDMTPEMVFAAAERGFTVWKIYAGITTGSKGIQSLSSLQKLFETVQKCNENLGKHSPRPVIVQIHAESPKQDILILDKEFEFHAELIKVLPQFPVARFCIEHISDRRTIELVKSMPPHVHGGLTPQHKLIWFNDLFYVTESNGDQHPGLQPVNFFLPCAKRKEDMLAIRAAGFSGNDKFHLGSDKAPHDEEAKFSCCGAAGADPGEDIVTLEADVAEHVGCSPEEFEAYTSVRAAQFYGVELDGSKIELVDDEVPHLMPPRYNIPGTKRNVPSFWANRPVRYRIGNIDLVNK